MLSLARIRFSGLFLGLLLLASCGASAPVARAGTLDLSRWDFISGGPAKLDGQWDFWWDRGISVPQVQELAVPGKADLPGFWNTAPGSVLPAQGAAAYRLRVQVPLKDGGWALALPDISSAWILWCNGIFVTGNGSTSADPGEYRPEVRPRTIRLPPPGPDGYDIFLYVVNQTDRVGGMRDSITFGPTDLMERNQRLTFLDSSFFSGGLLVMALFNLVIFFLQRQRTANLWLAAFSLVIAVRTLFVGPRLVQDIWTGLTFELSAKIEFFTILAAVLTSVFYLKSVFPRWWPARIFISFLFYTALFGILLFFLPLSTYADIFIGFYYLPLALMVFVYLGVCWWAMVKKHEDGRLVFFGMIFLIAGTLNDIIYQFVALPQGYVMGRVLFVFLIFNTFILSRQLSKDYALTQRQSGELLKLDKMKDDFLARVSHELRTPLNGMVGILDAFRMGDFGPLSDRQTYHLGLLESSGKRLMSMVNSILDFSHLRKDGQISDPRPILLKQTVDFLLPSFYSQMKSGIGLANRLPEALPAVLGDEVKLEQVLHNLILNALQHTDQGTVTVEAEVRDQEVLLMVRDTGPGISPEKLAQLFSPFSQAAEIDTRFTGGLGLGLAISRHLVEQMGGRLDIVSKEGSGTTARVWLPVCPPSKLQYFQAQRLDRGMRLDQGRFEGPPVPAAGPPPEALAVQVPAGTPEILIVDDEPVNLLVLRTFLARHGYTVHEAANGPEALEKLTKQVIDLVILDIMMPGMSGYEVCQKARERFSPARLPILLLTAKNQIEDLIQGYRSGASDFLTKPFQREELKARMDLHLKVSKAARTGLAVPNKP